MIGIVDSAGAVRGLVTETLRVALVRVPTANALSTTQVLSWVVPGISSALVALLAFWLGGLRVRSQERREAYMRVFGRISDLLRTLRAMEDTLVAVSARVFELSGPDTGSGAATSGVPGEFSSSVFSLARGPLEQLVKAVDTLEGNADDVVREYVGCATTFPSLEKAVNDARSEVRRFSITGRRVYLRLAHPERWVTTSGLGSEPSEVAEILRTADNARSELVRCFGELTFHFRRHAFGQPRRPLPVEATGNPDMRILTEDGMKSAKELGVYRGE
jgi:hypothetical protein